MDRRGSSTPSAARRSTSCATSRPRAGARTDRGVVHPLDDQLLGVRRTKQSRGHHEGCTGGPSCGEDADASALGEVAAEQAPMGQHVQDDGHGEGQADQLVRELEPALGHEEHQQAGEHDEDAGAHRRGSRSAPGVQVPRGSSRWRWLQSNAPTGGNDATIAVGSGRREPNDPRSTDTRRKATRFEDARFNRTLRTIRVRRRGTEQPKRSKLRERQKRGFDGVAAAVHYAPVRRLFGWFGGRNDHPLECREPQVLAHVGTQVVDPAPEVHEEGRAQDGESDAVVRMVPIVDPRMICRLAGRRVDSTIADLLLVSRWFGKARPGPDGGDGDVGADDGAAPATLPPAARR